MRTRILTGCLLALWLTLYCGCCKFNCGDIFKLLDTTYTDNPSNPLGEVTGCITHKNGEPVIGYEVRLEGAAIEQCIGAATNIDGCFRIPNVPAGGAYLVLQTDCCSPCGVDGHQKCHLKYPIAVKASTITNVVIQINCQDYPIAVE